MDYLDRVNIIDIAIPIYPNSGQFLVTIPTVYDITYAIDPTNPALHNPVIPPGYDNVNFYPITLTIVTTVTSDPDAVRLWIDDMLNYYSYFDNALIFGLDIQCSTEGRADILQLSIDRYCLIIQLSHATTVPNALRTFLTNPHIIFVASFDYEFYANNLYNTIHRLSLLGLMFIDLRSLFHRIDSLDTPAINVLGIDLQDCFHFYVSRIEWGVAQLTPDQIMFATTYAFVVWAIGRHFRNFNSSFLDYYLLFDHG